MAESGQHHLAHRRLLDLEAGKDGGIPPVKERLGGTPNVNAMRIAGWLWWAHLFGKPEDVNPPRKLALDLLAQQERQGHMLTEQCAPRPHDEYWIAPHAIFRWVALRREDPELTAATARWWRNELALCQAGACPDGEVHLACVRAGNEFGRGGLVLSDPAQPAMSAIWRLRTGLKAMAPVTEKSIGNSEFLGPRMVKRMIEAGDKLGVTDAEIKAGLPLPFLRIPMTVWRWPEGHQCAFETGVDPEPLNAPVVWINTEYRPVKGRKSAHLVVYGRDWTGAESLKIPRSARSLDSPKKPLPIKKEKAMEVTGGFAPFLRSKGCSRTAALVGPGLQKQTFPWDPTQPILGGADFAPSFEKRVGVAYKERRSPLEVETLVEPFNRLEAALAKASVCGLPKGYRITETDKTDLFYVLGFSGGLAIRDFVLPEVDRVLGVKAPDPQEPAVPPVAPPVNPPSPPAQPVTPAPAAWQLALAEAGFEGSVDGVKKLIKEHQELKEHVKVLEAEPTREAISLIRRLLEIAR